MENEYFINRDTFALIPISDNETKVVEATKEIIIKKSAMKIVKESCNYFGSSYEGRVEGTKRMLNMNYKLPIIIEDFSELIIFPTSAPRLESCNWIVLNNIEEYYKKDLTSTIEFRNNILLDIDLSYYILENQVFRATILMTKLKKRRTQKIV